MGQVFKGVASQGSPERRKGPEALKENRSKRQKEASPEPENAPEPSLQEQLSKANLIENGKVNSVKLEEIILANVENTQTQWEDISEELLPHVEKTLEDLAQDSEFTEKKEQIEWALGVVEAVGEQRAKKAQQHEDNVVQMKATAESIAASANKEDESFNAKQQEFQELMKRLNQMEDNAVALKKKLGWKSFLSTELRAVKNEIKNLTKQTDKLAKELEGGPKIDVKEAA